MLQQNLLAELQARNLVAQHTDFDALNEHLNSGMRTIYCGFDPTADSLHLGHLVPLLMLRRFQQAGHRPIVLVGGATGMIGDPSFKDSERQLQTVDTIQQWTKKLAHQTSALVSFNCGENAAIAVNNYDWTVKYDVLTFLRDIGKHFSVNMMINRESVKQRLNRPDQGISFTEFSYTLLQGLDYMELNKLHNCTVQIGGSDQWGNIMSGVELTRRSNNQTVHALTLPLITDANGKKFGKSEGNAVWLDASKTSPYRFYQFWMNVADADVAPFLKYFTFIPLDQIEQIAQAHAAEPHKREGQRTLAREMTQLIHGAEALQAAERITEALFSGDLNSLTEADMRQLMQDGVPSLQLEEGDIGLLDALVQTGLAGSNREARQFVQSNAVSVQGEKVDDAQMRLQPANARFGRYHILRRGKKLYGLVAHQA